MGVLGRTHDVHAGQLRPDLREHADHRAVDHMWLQELEICHVRVVALELDDLADLLQFLVYEGRIGVSFAVNDLQNLLSFLPAILLRQPTGRLWKEEQGAAEQNGRDHLYTPRNAERGIAVNGGRPVADEVHDHDSPARKLSAMGD